MFKQLISQTAFGFIRLLEWPFYAISSVFRGTYQIIIPANTYAPWLKDKVFRACFKRVKPNSLVNKYQAWELWKITEQIEKIPGEIIEVGVWRGSTSIIMGTKLHSINSSKQIYACDTFQGVVKAGSKEDNYYTGGEHQNTSIVLVHQLIKESCVNNVQLIKGIFPEESADVIAHLQFSLCHIDVDAYNSGKDILNWVWPRLSVGGIVVFNDYGFPLTHGITQLVEECRLKNDCMMFHNLNGNGILIKIK